MTTCCIPLRSTDPYLNLATEEFLLKNDPRDFFLTWRSQRAVVVGKHQNALAEIDHRYVRENRVHVARRLSGGGTVFHDEGNLNFTFIKTVERTDQINYQWFTQLMIGVLGELGLQAHAGPHQSIFLGQEKISGSADHVHKLRLMHHGTLLFNSRLDQLKNALKVDLSRFEDKSIPSNRSDVTNISGHLQTPMTTDAFAAFIFDQVGQTFPDGQVADLSAADLEAIRQLSDEKYSQWDWIYGYSPKYRYRNEVSSPSGKKISLMLLVEKGKIKESAWEGDLSASLAATLTAALKSQNHDYDLLKPLLTSLDPQLRREGFHAGQLLDRIV